MALPLKIMFGFLQMFLYYLSCRNISYGSVIGSGSVVVKNTDPMSVVGGNPAKELRKRKCVHSNLIVESLLGGDYDIYKKTRKKRHC